MILTGCGAQPALTGAAPQVAPQVSTTVKQPVVKAPNNTLVSQADQTAAQITQRTNVASQELSNMGIYVGDMLDTAKPDPAAQKAMLAAMTKMPGGPAVVDYLQSSKTEIQFYQPLSKPTPLNVAVVSQQDGPDMVLVSKDNPEKQGIEMIGVYQALADMEDCSATSKVAICALQAKRGR